MKIVVAVTAASGALYARLCLEQLLRAEEVSEIALVYSTHASEVADFEGVTMPEDPRIRIFDNDDLFAPPASGSADYDAMAVVPCSVGTLGRIACGVSQSLIERAADVMLNGSILPGITRNSVLQLCRDWGLPTEERKISVEELIQAQKEGKLEEVFGTGTAAVISPVGKLRYKDDVMVIGNGEIGPLSQKLYDTVTGIQLGRLEDKFGWRVRVD